MLSDVNITLTSTPRVTSPSDEGAQRGRLVARLNAALGYDDTNLTLEAKLRRALRAAKFEETPSHVWRKVLPTMSEGVSTMRANELFCWARSHIVDAELRKGAAVADAYRIAARRLLAGDERP